MISIVIPIYNGIEYINSSVSSVLSQTYNDWELIIGVNGHPKDSEVYYEAKKFEQLSIVENKITVLDLYYIKGKANALNHMIQHCQGNYIALLDVDDIWHIDKLYFQSMFIHRYDVIGSKCIYFGDINGVVPNIPVGNISDIDFREGNPIINSSVLIRKELCQWEENGIEDYDLWLRLRSQNKTFYNDNNVLVYHRIHRESAFNSKGHNEKLAELFFKYSNSDELTQLNI